MNFKALGKILGKIMILESVLMLAPFLMSIIYNESFYHKIAFVIPISALCLIGLLLQIPKPKRKSLYQKEGFALVALVWIVMALFGAIPFTINGDIPNYIDACFEIMSGFTTTGASVIPDISIVSHSTLFWRSFSHWIGGMGILVFVLIFIPESSDGSSMHLLRAESPGPQVGKIASKMKVTARILYLIYLSLTVIEIIVLMCGPLIDNSALVADNYASCEGDKFFYSMLTAFGCAGTGGFGFIPGSFQYFTPYAQYVVSIFLLIFGCNFALYYLILLGKIKDVFKSEEFRAYIFITIASVSVIFVSLLTKMSAIYSAEGAFRHSLFQVASIMTTTGYSTTDFNLWPMAAQTVLIILMFMGAMAGSTAGGMKTSRIVIATKGSYINIRKLINPRYVPKMKIEGKTLDSKTVNDVFAFITMYVFILFIVVFLLAFDPANGTLTPVVSDLSEKLNNETVHHGFYTNFSAALSCISNIGPGFEAVGPYLSFACYNNFSTFILTLTMLLGRLEILPVLILFTPRTWKRT
ncbi:MAG: TrkH family potassium uptake protein [Clostridia bacterium]|nr:TrkH family potassium uptake protein [Clostridia bacterium]